MQFFTEESPPLPRDELRWLLLFRTTSRMGMFPASQFFFFFSLAPMNRVCLVTAKPFAALSVLDPSPDESHCCLFLLLDAGLLDSSYFFSFFGGFFFCAFGENFLPLPASFKPRPTFVSSRCVPLSPVFSRTPPTTLCQSFPHPSYAFTNCV